jgi:predicted DNA-binding transcriptional regulator AlpA
MTEKQHQAAAGRVLGEPKRPTTKRAIVTATSDGQRILTYRDVAAITSFHIATLYRKVAEDKDFPQPVRLSENRVGFRESDVAKWVADREKLKAGKRSAKGRVGSREPRQLADASGDQPEAA